MPSKISRKPITQDMGQFKALAWLVLGLAVPAASLLNWTDSTLEKPLSLVAIYATAVLGLDLFVGASRRVVLQRIAPAVVLALLVTPGVPIAVAVIADILGTILVASTSRITWNLIGQAGRALLPCGLTAAFLLSRKAPTLDTYFFATEIFLVVSLFTRTTEEPYRSDLFLVVSYPAIALMLRSLAELHLAYVLLAVPLLFLLTTVDTEMLLRYFKLQQRLDRTETEIKHSRYEQRKTEIESRRKGVLLSRREQQLSLLNGLGREMDASQAAGDLGKFLLKESMRLTDADKGVILFSEGPGGRILSILCPQEKALWGIKVGDQLPSTVVPGISDKAPWDAPLWRNQDSFLIGRLGNEGWLLLSASDIEAFPAFLDDFFVAVGRHAGSAILALRRLSEVRETAQREAQEKEKVAFQNRNLRLLLENFDLFTEGALQEQGDLFYQGSESLKRMIGAEQVIFQAKALDKYDKKGDALQLNGQGWRSVIFLQGSGPSGNLLCLAKAAGVFSQAQVEWCHLLRDFLDKTVENSDLHRAIQDSYQQLELSQDEVVRSSQWAAAGRLAANAAHELNTPLGAIRLAAEQSTFFLEKTEGVPEPALTGIQSILRSVDRCRQVTDRLLITSRPVDEGETPAEAAPHSLLPIVKDAIDSVRPYLRASNIKLIDHRLVSDFEVKVVLQDLYWAVVNILKNGIDALNDTDVKDKRIAVALKPSEKFVELIIADNGSGVPEENKKKIFEAFFTTKKLGQGNGLGLSLSRTNLQRWGGQLKLGDSPEGATFIIVLPLVEGSPE